MAGVLRVPTTFDQDMVMNGRVTDAGTTTLWLTIYFTYARMHIQTRPAK